MFRPAPAPRGIRSGWLGAWVGALALGWLTGCRTPANGEPQTPEVPASQPSPGPSTNAVPALRPLGGAAGLIVQVQPALRFVVVDFSLNQLPGTGQVLVVYRAGAVVGSVKAGRVQRGSSLAADILSGELQVGDEVRPE